MHLGLAQHVVALTNGQRLPIRLLAAVVDVGQLGTLGKGLLAHHRDGSGDGYGGKLVAEEGVVRNQAGAFVDHHRAGQIVLAAGHQTIADVQQVVVPIVYIIIISSLVESAVTDGGDRSGDGHLAQVGAAVERLVADRGDTGGDHHRG